LITILILSIRLDEFLIVSFFFLLSPFAILYFIFFPLLKLQESITMASILPYVPSVDPSVLPTDWPIGSSHRYLSLLFYFSVRLTHREYMFFPPYYDPLLFTGSFSSFSIVLSWIKTGFFIGFFGLTRVNPSDSWPDHLTGSMTGSGFKTIIFVTYTPLLVPYFFSSYLKREHLWCCHCLHSQFGSSFDAVFFNWKYFKMIFYIFFSVFLSNFDMLI
jgi:hypothetical protein